MRTRLVTRSRAASLVGAAALAVVFAAGLGACSSGHVVSSDPDRFYLRVPSGWKIYHESQLLRSSNWSSLAASPPRFVMAASDDPHPSVSQPLGPAKYPWATLFVEDLSGSNRDNFTLGDLSDMPVSVDSLSEEGVPVQELQQGQLLVRGALRGTRTAYEVAAGSSEAIDFVQDAWVNSATNTLWALTVGCSPTCYQAHEPLINSVVDTFYVSDRGIS